MRGTARASPPRVPVEPAMRVGNYVLLDTLGEGAFGKVKLAVNEETGREYAIKIMAKSHIMAHELTLQVRREIAVMKALRHRTLYMLCVYAALTDTTQPISSVCTKC